MQQIAKYESGQKGRCPHCGKEARFGEARYINANSINLNKSAFYSVHLVDDDGESVSMDASTCSLCGKVIVWMDHPEERLLWPSSINRPVPKQVPSAVEITYKRATSHLGKDNTACTAFARTCLDKLFDNLDIPKLSNLKQRVKWFIENTHLPLELSERVDLIREMGNFIHLNEKWATGEIVDVEYDEALFVLDVLEALFAWIYVRKERYKEMGARMQVKIEAVNNKRKT